VATIGYKEVEFAGYFGKTPVEVRALLDNTGLQAPSAHVGLADIRTKWGAVLEGASEIGHRYLVCPSIDEKERDADGYKRVAQEFNEAAREAKRHGILFAYHNHDFDFAALGNTVGYDILLAETDPALVFFELDLYWVNKAARDPLAYFAKYPGRFPLVHVKDMAPDGAMSDVGSGRLPFARYFARSAEAGIRHYFVERDDATDAFASITRSYTSLKTLSF
jgi:sugar phosphate isomerase/epimerase